MIAGAAMMLTCVFGIDTAQAAIPVEAASADGIEVSLASDRTTAMLTFPAVASDRTIYLAYGYSDGGCEVSKWDHVVKFADVATGESGCTASLPPEARRAGVRMRFLMDKAVFTAASYVRQDDLLGQWDAIDGAPTVEGWRDLAGGAPLLWYGKPSFDERGVTLDGSTSLSNAVAGLKDALVGRAFTVQLMMHAEKVSEWAGYQTILNLGGTANRPLILDTRLVPDSGVRQHGAYTFAGLQFRESKWMGRSTVTAPNDYFDRDVLVTVTVDSSGAHLWTNDAAEPIHSTVGGTAVPASDDVSFFRSNATTCYPGRIYGIRFYRRALTADEIAANCRVDFARYASQAARCSKLVEIGHGFATDVSDDWSKASFSFESSGKVRAIYLAYGPADAGHAAADWAHCVKLADVPADTTSLADVALPSDLKSSPENRYARFLMDSNFGTYDYVQEGLMSMWDAVENAGRGMHDAAAAEWKDLVGTSDLSPYGSPVFNADSVTLADNSAFDGPVDGIASAFQHSGFTVQLMMRPTVRPTAYSVALHIGSGNSNRQLILDSRKENGQDSWYSFAGLQFRESAWQSQSTVQPENDYAGKDVEVTVTVDRKGANLWFDDAETPHFTTEGGTASSVSDAFHLGRHADGHCYPMTIYGARLYNRPLTVAEIARNTAVDRERVERVFVAASPSYMLPSHPFVANVERGKWMSATFTPTHRPRKLIFAWDVEDRGATLADWANSVVLANVPADAWKLEKVVLPADRGDASAGRFFLEADCVQEGLYAQWDAEYNADGGRHAANPSAWIDLVGGQALFPVNKSDFDEKSVLLTGENYFNGEVSGVAQFFRNKSFTVQLACRPGGFVKYAAALYFGQDSAEQTLVLDQRKESAQSTNYTFGAVQYLESGWKSRSTISEENDYFGKDVLVTVTTDSSGAHLWLDNASSSFFTTVGGALVPSTDWFYLGYYPGSSSFKMTVYGVRIYNRTLTADEIATNWNVDNGRFFGGTPQFEVSEAQDIRRPGFRIIFR